MIYNKKELIAMMGDKDWDIRCIAVKNCDGDHDILMKAINDASWHVRLYAMEDENPNVRFWATQQTIV